MLILIFQAGKAGSYQSNNTKLHEYLLKDYGYKYNV